MIRPLITPYCSDRSYHQTYGRRYKKCSEADPRRDLKRAADDIRNRLLLEIRIPKIANDRTFQKVDKLLRWWNIQSQFMTDTLDRHRIRTFVQHIQYRIARCNIDQDKC